MKQFRYPLGHTLDYYDKNKDLWLPCRVVRRCSAFARSYRVALLGRKYGAVVRATEDVLGETVEALEFRKSQAQIVEKNRL